MEGRGAEQAHPEVDEEAQHVLRCDAGAGTPLPSRPLPRSNVGEPSGLQLLLETSCEEVEEDADASPWTAATPAPELPMGPATLGVDHRQPWRWADGLGEDDLADEEEGSAEKGQTPRGSRGHLGFDVCEEKGLTPRGSRGHQGFDAYNERAADDNQCRNLPRPDVDATRASTISASTTQVSAGDRFTFAVRAIILLIRCCGAMLASCTRPLFAWAASAALFRYRCPCDTAARFELLFSSSAIKLWPKSLPKAARRGHGNRGGKMWHGPERLRAFCNRQSAAGGRRRILSTFSNVWSSTPQRSATATTSPLSAGCERTPTCHWRPLAGLSS